MALFLTQESVLNEPMNYPALMFDDISDSDSIEDEDDDEDYDTVVETDFDDY